MNTSVRTTEEQVKAFCALIGTDPLLVQGAGGNVSWKDGNILWVKASGTWLAEATTKEIFVPVDLAHLRQAIAKENFATTPRIVGDSHLKPSIETFLHALMPQCVVVHLHAIEVLAHLVHDNFQADFESLLDESILWAVVEYYRPGAAIAAKIATVMIQKPAAKVIFLKNHGVVIGGADIEEVYQIMCKLTRALSTKPADICSSSHFMSVPPENILDQYTQIADVDIHQLALNHDFFNRLSADWALYPDHIVFLGPRAYTYRTWESFNNQKIFLNVLPELIFINNGGVYTKTSFSKTKQIQLRCYYDVLVRQKSHFPLKILTDIQISELLNWDAEQYRINFAK